MLTALRRHPIPIEAFFEYSLVLTYCFPEDILRPLLPPGLTLETFDGNGFLAIALVRTAKLRPAGFPETLGRNFFLSGYRVFSRYQRHDGKILRGLRILRSDADSRLMVWGGNLLTHYRYRKCVAEEHRSRNTLDIRITTRGAEADLCLRAHVGAAAELPPEGSPFPNLSVARRFAGPLPFTFDYEAGSQQMIIIRGVRENWTPTPVRVEVSTCTFLAKPPFNACTPRLANAFFVQNVPYRWERGVLAPLATEAA